VPVFYVVLQGLSERRRKGQDPLQPAPEMSNAGEGKSSPDIS
jgi:hypothetical protein